MRKLILLCCFIISIHTISRAQVGISPASQTDSQKLSASLSKNQKAKIKAIYDDLNKEIQQTAKTSKSNRADMNKKMMQLISSTTEKVRAVLTPAQAALYKKVMDEHQPQVR